MEEFEYTNLVNSPCELGRLDIVKYLEEDIRPIPNISECMESAANRGHGDMFDYLATRRRLRERY